MFLPVPSIKSREWGLVGVVTVLAVAWSLVPTWTGLLQTPPGQQYLFTNIPDVVDFQVYFSFIDQNAQGHVFFKNLFTHERQAAVFFSPLWLILGGLKYLSDWSAPVVFTIGRGATAAALLGVIYWFIAHWLDKFGWRFLAWLTAVFGGGLGGLALTLVNREHRFIYLFTQPDIVSRLPADVTSPAGFPWLMINHAPHNLVALTLVLTTWILFWRGRSLWPPGTCIVLLGLIHPYDLALVFGVLFLHAMMMLDRYDHQELKKYVRRLGRLLTWATPVVAYYAAALMVEPTLRSYYQQNFLPALNLISLAAGYGLLGPLAIYGLFLIRRTTDPRWLMMTAWLTGGLILFYLPLLSFQVKMLLGYSIPLAIFATVAWHAIWSRLKTLSPWRSVRILPALLLMIVTFSTVIIYPAHVRASQKNERKYHYASIALLDALGWLKINSQPEAVVLGDFATGNLVPQFANRATYLGHNIQTVDYQKRLELIRGWFITRPNDDRAKIQFLRDNGINFVVWGPNERPYAAWRPDVNNALKPVFNNQEVTIYTVN